MPTYPFNLTLTNPGAEAGDTSGWTQLAASNAAIRNSGDDISAHSGSKYFAVSATEPEPWWGQVVEITDLGVIADIDAGKLSIQAAVYQQGLSGDADKSALGVECFNSSGAGSDANWLAGKWQPLVDPTSWVKGEVVLSIPPGTRFIRISARGLRAFGTQNSAYLDDFELNVIDESKISELLFSMGAGSASGWTDVQGTLAATAARSYGEIYTVWTASALGEATRDIAIPSGWNAAVDAGLVAANLLYNQAAFNGGTNDEPGRTYLEFYDGSAVIIGSRVYSDVADYQAITQGEPKQLLQDVPAGTRTIKLGLVGTRVGGTNLDANFGRMSLSLERDAAASSEPASSEVASSESSAPASSEPASSVASSEPASSVASSAPASSEPASSVAPVPTIWNPADKSPSIVLSEGNKRYNTDGSANGGVRSNNSKNAGKWYFEFNTIDADDVFGNTAAGIATAAATLANFPSGGAGNNFLMDFTFDGASIVAVALDLDNGRIWIRKDGGDWVGDDIGNPAANTNGTAIADFIPGWTSGVTEIFIAACGGGDGSDDGMTLAPGAVIGNVPVGFETWDEFEQVSSILSDEVSSDKPGEDASSSDALESDRLASEQASSERFSSDHHEEISSDRLASDEALSEEISSEVQSELQDRLPPPIQCVVTVAS